MVAHEAEGEDLNAAEAGVLADERCEVLFFNIAEDEVPVHHAGHAVVETAGGIWMGFEASCSHLSVYLMIRCLWTSSFEKRASKICEPVPLGVSSWGSGIGGGIEMGSGVYSARALAPVMPDSSFFTVGRILATEVDSIWPA